MGHQDRMRQVMERMWGKQGRGQKYNGRGKALLQTSPQALNILKRGGLPGEKEGKRLYCISKVRASNAMYNQRKMQGAGPRKIALGENEFKWLFAARTA